MAREHTSTKRILVQVDTRHAASREMIAGVMRYAATHSNIEIQFSGFHPSSAPVEYFRSWKPDALIADSTVHTLTSQDFASLSGKAVVFVNTLPRRNCRKPFAILSTDDHAMAAAAADLLISKRLQHFAYVGAPKRERWSETRERLFCARLNDRGYCADIFHPPSKASWQTQENALANWLAALPKPCGVWAAYDQRAKHVIDACRLANVAIPDQVQVLGVDNEPYICEHTSPSLSSIAPDFNAGGYAAASFADMAIEGNKHPNENAKISFQMRGIVERLSTSDINGHARHIAIANDFIRRNAINGIGVREVAAAVGVSVRLLQKDFPAIMGYTVIDALISTKIETAKTLLRKTATPLSEIARLSGFANATHLMTIFKKRTGMTMTEFRSAE